MKTNFSVAVPSRDFPRSVTPSTLLKCDLKISFLSDAQGVGPRAVIACCEGYELECLERWRCWTFALFASFSYYVLLYCIISLFVLFSMKFKRGKQQLEWKLCKETTIKIFVCLRFFKMKSPDERKVSIRVIQRKLSMETIKSTANLFNFNKANTLNGNLQKHLWHYLILNARTVVL